MCVVCWGGEGHSGSDLPPGKLEANPSCNWGGCRKQPPTLIAVVQQVCALCRCYMLLCFAPYPAGDLGGNDWNVDCEPT